MTSRLPRSLEDLRDLRAARWTRESTAGQVDRFGPTAQREQQDRAIERHGLVDSGIAWSVAHSGRTIASTGPWAEMLATAGSTWDVLVVGYVSRFARDLRTAVNARHDLHAAGAAILFVDERVLSSDEDEWERWAREAVEAESYSRRLSRRVREAFAAKRRTERDYGSGETSFGFRRVDGLIEPDPVTMPVAVEAFRLAAAGASDRDVGARLGLGIWRVRTMLRSPLYDGRLPDGGPTRFPAPVPHDLVEGAALQRIRRTTSGHQPARHRVYPLSDRGPLSCGRCDRPLKGAFRIASGRRVYRHPDACSTWSPAESSADELERQVGRLLAGATPNRESAARIRVALAQPVTSPDRLALARVDAELRRVALSLVERPDPFALRRLEELHAERDTIAAATVIGEGPSAEEALDYLADLGKLWAKTTDEGRRALAVGTFARLGAAPGRIVDVDVSPYAAARGLVLTLPTRVTGVGGTGKDAGPVTWPIRVVGRREWLRATRSA